MGLVSSYGTKGTETALILTAYNFHGGGVLPGFIVCHGFNGTPENAIQPGGGAFATAQALAPLGVVNAPDLGGPSTWGNDAAQAKFADAFNYLTNTLGTKSPIGVVGLSMGGCLALNYFKNNPTQISALALGMPLVDLAYAHDNNFTAPIEAAYGGSAGYQAAVATHDPMQNTAAYVGKPIKMWRASNDTVAMTSRQDAFAAATGCEVVDLGAVGHTLENIPGDQIRSFLAAHT